MSQLERDEAVMAMGEALGAAGERARRDVEALREGVRRGQVRVQSEYRTVEDQALVMLGFTDTQRIRPVFKVMLDALRIIADREAGERKGVWKRSGLRGQCMHLFAKGERAFTQAMRGEIPSRDNFLDAINYAAFAELLRQNDDVPECYALDGSDAEDHARRILNGDWPWEG